MANFDFPQPYGFCNNLRPTEPLEETWNPIRGMFDIVKATLIQLRCYGQIRANEEKIGSNFFGFQQIRDDMAFFYNGTILDLAIILLLAVLWTVARKAFVEFVSPFLVGIFGVLPKSEEKFKESAWKVCDTALLSFTNIYIAFYRDHDLFNTTMTFFVNWPETSFPLDLKIVYFMEASYYIHGFYAIFFMDRRRHDTAIMCLHHFVALSLVGFSYLTGVLKIGVLIFALDDISDFFVAFCNFWTCLREVRSGKSKLAEYATYVGFIGLTFTWVYCRVICHLTKVWRSASLGTIATLRVLPVPFFLYFNILLGLLYVMYLYWFGFLIKMIYLLVTGKTKQIDDTREIDVDEEKKD